MSEHPTIQQILSDPRSADRAALDYCNEEVRNCLDKADDLRKENAALWSFVRADDLWTLLDQSRSDPADWSPESDWLKALDAREAARTVLRTYQDGGDR